MYNVVMLKRLFALILCFFLALPVFAEAIKGGIEQTDTNVLKNQELFTGEIDLLDEKDTIKMTVSQILNGTYTEVGDEFFAEITEDVMGGKKNSGVIIPKGSIVHGTVSVMEDPKRLGRDGYMVTVFDYIVTPDGRQIPIEASLSTKENLVKGTAKNVAKHVGITAVGGVTGGLFALNLLGFEAAIASNGATLAGGAAIGGAVGLVSAMASRGKTAKIKPGDELKIKMITNIEIPVMSKDAFRRNDILLDGLEVEIYKVILDKDPFDEDYILTLDLKINNKTNKTFYAFDIALMDEIKHISYPSPLGNTSLWFKKITPGEVVIGKLSFAISNKKNKHWLVFFDRSTRKTLAKYSIENIIATGKVNKSKKTVKNSKN